MPFKHILIATDFSDSSRSALDLASELALRFQAELTLMHSWDAPGYAYGAGLYLPLDLVASIEQAATTALLAATTELRQRVPGAHSLLCDGPAWQKILEAAKGQKADLIVLGTHGRTGMTRALMGSVAEKVVRLADVPVLTTHAPTPEAA